jgi:hypothetical protein
VNSVQAAAVVDAARRSPCDPLDRRSVSWLIEAAETILAERDRLAAENGRLRADIRTLDVMFGEMREAWTALGLDDSAPGVPAFNPRTNPDGSVTVADPQRDPDKPWFRKASA